MEFESINTGSDTLFSKFVLTVSDLGNLMHTISMLAQAKTSRYTGRGLMAPGTLGYKGKN
jgi:hypothetical protein